MEPCSVVALRGVTCGVLQDVTLNVKEGEIVGLVGPAGAGKTSCIECMRGNSRGEGEIYFCGRLVRRNTLRAHQVGYVLGTDRYYDYLTVKETLQVGAQFKIGFMTKRERANRVTEVLKMVGLEGCMSARLGSARVGRVEMKLISIAIALLPSPKLLLLDEPFLPLGLQGADRVIRVLQGVAARERVAVVVGTRDPYTQVVIGFTRLVYLFKGQILVEGSVQEISASLQDSGIRIPKFCLVTDFLSQRLLASAIQLESQSDGSTVAPSADDASELLLSSDILARNHETNERHLAVRQEVDLLALQAADLSDADQEKSPEGATCRGCRSCRNWWMTLGGLTKRLSLGIWRNPISVWVMMLLWILPALLLGGCFFNLPRNINEEISPITLPANARRLVVDFDEYFNPEKSVALSLIFPANPEEAFVQAEASSRGAVGLMSLAANFSSLAGEPSEENATPRNDFLGIDIGDTGRALLEVLKMGVDGNFTRPLVEMLENGIDGQGSKPLTDLLVADSTWYYLNDTITCVHQGFGIGQASPTYPPSVFTNPTTWPDKHEGSYGRLPDPAEEETAEMDTDLKRALYAGNRRLLESLEDNDDEDLQLEIVLDIVAEIENSIARSSGRTGSTGGIRDHAQMRRLAESAIANSGMGITGIVTLFQVIDYMTYRVNYAPLEGCMGKANILSIILCFLGEGDYIFKRLFDCGKLPYPIDGLPLSMAEWLAGFLPSGALNSRSPNVTVSETNHDGKRLRRLIKGGIAFPSGESLNQEDSDIFFSTSSIALLDSLEAFYRRMDACDSAVCRGLKLLGPLFGYFDELLENAFATLNITGSNFFVLAMLAMGGFDTIMTFHEERRLANQESFNGFYSIPTWFLAKNFADLPIQWLFSIVCTLTWSIMSGFFSHFETAQVFLIFATALSTTFAAVGLAYAVASVIPRLEWRSIVSCLLYILLLFFGGAVYHSYDVQKSGQWLLYLSFYRWGLFGFMGAMFPDGGYFGVEPNSLTTFLGGIADRRVWFCICMNLVLGASFRLVAFFFLLITGRTSGIY